MPQIYKVCVLNHLSDNANEVFAIKPYLDSFDSFKDEIYIRMPELKNQQFRIYYEDEEGDKITIFNALDFGIFQEQKIKKVFVVKTNGTAKSVQFQEKRNVAPTAAAAAPAPAPAASSATLSTSTSAPQLSRVLHPNVICDGCDKSIFGYRYKCLECADFDLCMECEPKSHGHHLMVRIADPSDAEICYRSKLGKRFLRHRRSESLCMKSEEKEKEKEKRHHHGHHHKRHASSASGVRPPTVGDVLCSVLKSFAPVPNEANANNKASGGTGANKPPNTSATAAQSQKTSTSTSSTNATQTPTNPPAYGFNFQNPNERPPCAVPLKHGIDMLQHVAQNFAAMMDPFATFMDQQNASGTAPTAPTATATPSPTATANVNAVAAEAIKTATEVMKTATEAVKTAASVAGSQFNEKNDETEPLIAVDSDDDALPEQAAEKPNQQQQDVMIVDCSDDDEEDLRHLVTSMNVSRKSSGGGSGIDAANKKDERAGSIESDKGSPIREWTFIEPNEIAESAGAVASNGGAIPKKTTPPPSAPAQADQSNQTNNNVDYAELSRLLSTHIVAQNQATPSTSAQPDAKAQGEIVTDSAAKSAKTPPPTPMHPDARVNESLNAMMAMGFSNEGGWLTQLLETVDGSISNALDLLQPHK